MSYQCHLTFSVKDIKIDIGDGNELTVKLHCGDDLIFSLKQNENEIFIREITISFESMGEHLMQHFMANTPKKLILTRHDEQIGECPIDWFQSNIEKVLYESDHQSNEMEQKFEIIKFVDNDDDDETPIFKSTVTLNMRLVKNKINLVTSEMSFETFGGNIEPEELLYKLTDNSRSQSPIDKPNENYFIVNGNLRKLNDTNTTDWNMERTDKFECHNSRFLENARAINPYLSKSEGSIDKILFNCNINTDTAPRGSNRCDLMDQFDTTLCDTICDSYKFQDDLCPNYRRNVSYKSKKWCCPLCETMKKSSVQTPILVSMSDELKSNNLPNDTLPCPCACLKRPNSTGCRKKSKRHSLSDDLSQNNMLRSRFSNGGSQNIISRVHTDLAKMQANPNKSLKKRGLNSYDNGENHKSRTSQRIQKILGRYKKGRNHSNDPEMNEEMVKIYIKHNRKHRKGKNGSSCDPNSFEDHLTKFNPSSKVRGIARKRVSKKNKIRSRYSYCFGKNKFEFKIGHNECTTNRGLVPKNMGWLWNVPTLGINKDRHGWKPGAVTQPIKELMMHFLTNYPCDTLPVIKSPKQNKGTEKEICSMDPCKRSILQVKPGKEQYLICMNPIKDSQNKGTDDSSPIKIKIVENDKNQNTDETNKKVPDANEEENFVNIEFTPPSALAKGNLKKPKRDSKATATQYNDNDFKSVAKGTDKANKKTNEDSVKGVNKDAVGRKSVGNKENGSTKKSKVEADKQTSAGQNKSKQDKNKEGQTEAKSKKGQNNLKDQKSTNTASKRKSGRNQSIGEGCGNFKSPNKIVSTEEICSCPQKCCCCSSNFDTPFNSSCTKVCQLYF